MQTGRRSFSLNRCFNLMKGRALSLEEFESKQPLTVEAATLAALYKQRQLLRREHSSIVSNTPARKQQTKEEVALCKQPFLLTHLLGTACPDNGVNFYSFFRKDLGKKGKAVDSDLEQIFITTFGFETEVFERVAASGVPLTLMNEWDQKDTLKNYLGFKNWTVIRPKMAGSGYSVFHPKLWLLKFRGFLRVVVGTANNHVGDWALWMNSFWVQDFALGQQQETVPEIDKDFRTTLLNYFQSLFKNQEQRAGVGIDPRRYNYKELDVYLIPTLPRKYERAEDYGLAKVSRVLSQSKKQFKTASLVYQSTSLGIITKDLQQQIIKAFAPGCRTCEFKALYPSTDYVESLETEPCTLFLKAGNYNKDTFMKNSLHKFESTTGYNYVPHLKMVVVQEKGEGEGETVVYMGSHNLTKAAWGTRGKGQNSELGVLYTGGPHVPRLLNLLPFKLQAYEFQKGQRPFMI